MAKIDLSGYQELMKKENAEAVVILLKNNNIAAHSVVKKYSDLENEYVKVVLLNSIIDVTDKKEIRYFEDK